MFHSCLILAIIQDGRIEHRVAKVKLKKGLRKQFLNLINKVWKDRKGKKKFRDTKKDFRRAQKMAFKKTF